MRTRLDCCRCRNRELRRKLCLGFLRMFERICFVFRRVRLGGRSQAMARRPASCAHRARSKPFRANRYARTAMRCDTVVMRIASLVCAQGKFANVSGQAQCSNCPAGSFSYSLSSDTTGPANCTLCSPGWNLRGHQPCLILVELQARPKDWPGRACAPSVLAARSALAWAARLVRWPVQTLPCSHALTVAAVPRRQVPITGRLHGLRGVSAWSVPRHRRPGPVQELRFGLRPGLLLSCGSASLPASRRRARLSHL